jgi:hypothetical protein
LLDVGDQLAILGRDGVGSDGIPAVIKPFSSLRLEPGNLRLGVQVDLTSAYIVRLDLGLQIRGLLCRSARRRQFW